jgi:hypothetical protein
MEVSAHSVRVATELPAHEGLRNARLSAMREGELKRHEIGGRPSNAVPAVARIRAELIKIRDSDTGLIPRAVQDHGAALKRLPSVDHELARRHAAQETNRSVAAVAVITCATYGLINDYRYQVMLAHTLIRSGRGRTLTALRQEAAEAMGLYGTSLNQLKSWDTKAYDDLANVLALARLSPCAADDLAAVSAAWRQVEEAIDSFRTAVEALGILAPPILERVATRRVVEHLPSGAAKLPADLSTQDKGILLAVAAMAALGWWNGPIDDPVRLYLLDALVENRPGISALARELLDVPQVVVRVTSRGPQTVLGFHDRRRRALRAVADAMEREEVTGWLGIRARRSRAGGP